MDDLDAATWRTFSDADAIVVSTEDLSEVPDDPFTQAVALRQRLGPGPLVVLTLGAEGYLIDDPEADRIVAAVPRRVVDGVSAVGAGDTFGVVLAIRLAEGDGPRRAARTGTDRVIALLERRRA
jgi:sugar/nucleoside kinase (ribokinase family)